MPRVGQRKVEVATLGLKIPPPLPAPGWPAATHPPEPPFPAAPCARAAALSDSCQSAPRRAALCRHLAAKRESAAPPPDPSFPRQGVILEITSLIGTLSRKGEEASALPWGGG